MKLPEVLRSMYPKKRAIVRTTTLDFAGYLDIRHVLNTNYDALILTSEDGSITCLNFRMEEAQLQQPEEFHLAWSATDKPVSFDSVKHNDITLVTGKILVDFSRRQLDYGEGLDYRTDILIGKRNIMQEISPHEGKWLNVRMILYFAD